MRYIILFFTISVLSQAQSVDSKMPFSGYLRKLNLSFEGGFFRQEQYYKGDLSVIDPFPYPVSDPYPKVKLGYELSPKLSAEYSFSSFKLLSFKGFKKSFAFNNFKDAGVEFSA